jgi:hypothetical protein
MGKASKAFQHWIDQLILGLKNTLLPVLEKSGMVEDNLFKERLGLEPWKPILEVADFNSIIALSQEHQVPVYALTPEHTGQQGAVWDQTKKSMDVFFKAFDDCADKVFELTN